jgi:very-short-patch-repair endonuclease
MRECFMRGLSARLVDHALRERSALRGFDDKAHTRELNRFKELDAKIAEGYYQVVPRMLYESRPKGLKDTALKELGQVGLLSRWVGRKRGGDTVRKVLEQWPGAVTALKPCFLMSPASVAQYLPVDTEGKGMQFDVVIFDEASQIPVPDAIGAVARGKSLVVVGDSKQMPPTAFFKAADDEDSELGPDLLVEDAESILTECEQANLPALWLNWHYRSRHESLIAFSNAHYYEGRLTSFPSPHKTSSRYGVSFHKVDGGYYDTGKTRTNPPEADAIVQEIARMCADPVECKRSIGVVTFNMQQQELVLDKLEDRAESLPALKAAMDGDGVEPLFVKNLENVQGDERDIILFSICYGPTQEGKAPSMNFGPLNRAGGERRLNVAVTRAREKVQVFATLLPGMIDLSRTNSIGAAHLKAFLEMAQKGTSGEVSSQAAQGCDKDAYRAEIAAALRGRGLTVREQLGMSEFKVDLALGVDESAEVFRAAVLLDGPGYRDLPTTRDRDSIPPLMLEDLGWAIYRIWLPAWIHERDRLLDEIVELVRTPPEADGPQEQAPTAPEIPEAPSTDDAVGSRVNLEGSAGESTSTIKAPPDSEPEPTGASMYEGGELFVPFVGGRALGTKEDFELGAGIENGVREVLAAEGPVQADRLGQLVARRFGFKRVPSARVKTVLDHLPTRARRHRSSFGEFIWPEDKAPDSWAGFRYSVERGERSVDELAAEEVRNLMLQATHESLGLSRSELLRLCADVFSLGNLGKKIVARLDSILEWALAEGVLVDQDGVIVPGP